MRHGENDLVMWKKILEARPLIEDAGFPYTPVMGDALLFRPYRCGSVAGSPCISPDGGLSVCPTMAPKDRYGDIWNGVTDETVREEYSRMDRTREKCRLCPYLPNCTPYEHCPGENTHCREVNDLLMREFLEMLTGAFS